MHSSTWHQPFNKWPSSIIKMPPKPNGKKSQSTVKNTTEKTTRQKKKGPPKRPPAKTGMRASEASRDSTMAGQKRNRKHWNSHSEEIEDAPLNSSRHPGQRVGSGEGYAVASGQNFVYALKKIKPSCAR